MNISEGGLRLLVDRPLAAGLPLQVEWDDILLLGDVCYCQPAEEGFAIGLKLEHALLHTKELANFSRALLGAVEAAQGDQSQPAPVRKRPD